MHGNEGSVREEVRVFMKRGSGHNKVLKLRNGFVKRGDAHDEIVKSLYRQNLANIDHNGNIYVYVDQYNHHIGLFTRTENSADNDQRLLKIIDQDLWQFLFGE